jgi:hypothetical protein
MQLTQQLERGTRLLQKIELPPGVVHLWVRQSRSHIERIYGATAPELAHCQLLSLSTLEGAEMAFRTRIRLAD